MNLSICIMLGIVFSGGSDIAFGAHSKRKLSEASPSSGPITEALQKVLYVCIQTYFKHLFTCARTGGKMCQMCHKDYTREKECR
jgi:hypothetical protein